MGIQEAIEKKRMKGVMSILDGEKFTSLKIFLKVEENILMVYVKDAKSGKKVELGFLLKTVYSLSDLIKAMINKKAELDQQGGNDG